MLVHCKKCGSKARIASSRTISTETRELYCQCLNLNCSVSFVSHVTFSHEIEQTGKKPDFRIQPELVKDGGQIDAFDN